MEFLLEVDTEPWNTNNRFNDGKADPANRLWAGTMGPEPEIGKLEKEKGSLYTLLAKNKVKKHLTKVSISNGLAWNTKVRKMYYIDSPKRIVDQYDYDIVKGEISRVEINKLYCFLHCYQLQVTVNQFSIWMIMIFLEYLTE